MGVSRLVFSRNGVSGSVFHVRDLGFRGSWFIGLGFRGRGFAFWVSGWKLQCFEVRGFPFVVRGFAVRGFAFAVRVSGLEFWGFEVRGFMVRGSWLRRVRGFW